MKVQVAKWGNSTAVRLPTAVVKQLGLRPGMALDVSVDAGAVKLEPAEGNASAPGAGPTPEPFPVTAEWMLAEVERLGGLKNQPRDDVDWGPDVGSEIIYDDYNPRRRAD
jgi:antitoxin MazE